MTDRNELLNAARGLIVALREAAGDYGGERGRTISTLADIVQGLMGGLYALPYRDATGEGYRDVIETCRAAANAAAARPPAEGSYRSLYEAARAAIAALGALIERIALSPLPSDDATIFDPGLPPPPPFFGGARAGRAPPAILRRERDEATAPPHGRYEARLPEAAIDLRVDRALGVASADFFRIGIDGSRTWVASARSSGAVGTRCEAIFEDRYGVGSTGWMEFTSATPEALHGAYFIRQRLDGLPYGRTSAFTAIRRGDSLRQIGLEYETEQDVDPPPTVDFGGQRVSVASTLADAGFETTIVGAETRIAKAPPNGWSEKNIEALMYESAQINMNERAFALQVLWLSKSNRPGLLGVMFDTRDALPRQSLAVFAGEISSRMALGFERDRKLIQTTVHEIGHALNLAHRFEREVGRADSHSIMNYDWRFKGGNRVNEFWTGFRFAFDADELSFLRHCPYDKIIQGGAPFHSVRYWNEGDGGYSPYVPEEPLRDLSLEIQMPGNGGHFSFGEPVILGLELTNRLGRSVTLPKSILDVKAGFLELLIARAHLGRRRGGEMECFRPIVARCFDFDAAETVTLLPGGKHIDNVNVTFGSSGFSFAEPGAYDVRALLVFYDQSRDVEYIASSAATRIFVGYPNSDDLQLADVLFEEDTGRWFAMGAPDRLRSQRDKLSEALVANPKSSGADRIRAHVVRTAMFGHARSTVTKTGEVRGVRNADLALARQLADEVSRYINYFDPSTANETTKFIKQVLPTLGGAPAPDSSGASSPQTRKRTPSLA